MTVPINLDIFTSRIFPENGTFLDELCLMVIGFGRGSRAICCVVGLWGVGIGWNWWNEQYG